MYPRWTRWAARLAVAAAFAAAPAGAGAVPFGADLNLTPNTNFDCTFIPVVGPFGNPVLLPSFQPTCTWMGVGSVAQPQVGGGIVPANGVVTQVRLRVGGTTGPMRVVVLRSFRDQNSTASPACCTEVAETAVFTPPPNAVTVLNTALPVHNDLVGNDPATGMQTFDSLGLSILAPGVSIPLFDTGAHDPSNFSIPQALATFPAYTPGQTRADGAGVGGFQLLLQGELVPTVVTPPAPAGPAPIALALLVPTAPIVGGNVVLTLRCAAAVQCVGFIVLQSARSVGASPAASKKKAVTYGRARFKIDAGKKKKLKVKLSRTGRKLVKKHKRTKVWMNVKIGSTTTSSRVTLRR